MTVASDAPAQNVRSKAAQRPNRLLRNLSAKIASIPMILTALFVFVGGTAWTITYSFTNSRMLPRENW
ncbi:MAG: sugar ABC transporter permease, partial [Pseudomonadota bacterium]